MLQIPWSVFREVISSSGAKFRQIETSSMYYLFTINPANAMSCMLPKDSGSEQTDFEANFKALADTGTTQLDTDGAAIVRNKAAKTGWTYCSLPFEFETARLSDTLYSKDSAGNSRTFITMKAYDINDVEVTTPGLLNANYASIVKTVIDFEPPYDFEIIGGILRTLSTINVDLRLWIIAVPDIPAPTGSKEMGGGINLRYLAPGNEFAVDGRVTKFASYNAVYHTNKIRMVFKYPAGTNESLQVVVEMYKA